MVFGDGTPGAAGGWWYSRRAGLFNPQLRNRQRVRERPALCHTCLHQAHQPGLTRFQVQLLNRSVAISKYYLGFHDWNI